MLFSHYLYCILVEHMEPWLLSVNRTYQFLSFFLVNYFSFSDSIFPIASSITVFMESGVYP